MQPTTKSRREIQNIVRHAVDDAVSFVEGEISDDRIKAQRYFDGEVDIGYEDGRSKCVATKCRDVVRAVKPSLMRVFMSTANAVEFIPRTPADVPMAEQCTNMVNYEFNRLNGFRVLSDALHDALIKKMGIIRCAYRDTTTAKIYTFTEMSEDEYNLLTADPDVEVLEQSMEMRMEMDDFGMDIEAPVFDVKISRKHTSGDMELECIPPEEFFVNASAKTLQDAYIVAHRTDMRAGDLVAMGCDAEDIYGMDSFDSGTDMSEAETLERRGYDEDFSEDEISDPSMRAITVTTAYMRMDIEGSGVPILHKFLLGGTKYQLLDYEPVDEIPYAKLEVDPEAHTFYGRSLVEIIMDDQDAATSVLRGILDNVALTNAPQRAFIDGQVNVDDLLNSEIGGLVRMRQAGAIQELSVPFAAGQTLSALTYLDQLVEQKTGVTRASMGLDPDAMQSTTKAAVQATVQAAAGQVEVMVRNLADGLRDLFGIMQRTLNKNVQEDRYIKLNGGYVPINPAVWDSGLDMQINVGLGTGREEEKGAALNQALQMQTMVYQNYGPMNGLVSLTNIRNTLADLLAVQGVKNADRYFAPITPEIEAQLLQMQQQQQAAMAQQAQQQGDPNQALLMAEQMRAQGKLQSDAMRMQLDQQKAVMDDDLKRDQMAQDLLVDAAKIYGQYGTAVDTAAIKAEQEKQRDIVQAMTR